MIFGIKGDNIMDREKSIFVRRVTELSNIVGPSYRENRVIDYLVESFKNTGGKITVDNIGNITVKFLSKKKDAKVITIFAHSDEIGFIIRKIEKNGFLRVERIGGVNRNILHGATIQFINSKGDVILGVIGVKSHHFMKDFEKCVVSPMEDLYVDVGAFSQNDVEKMGLRIGSVGAFYSKARVNGDLIIGKAMDDRANCAVLLSLAEKLKDVNLKYTVCITISVQEEFNIRGILPAIASQNPYIAIGLDITPSCDTPDLLGFSDVAIDKGVAITAMNFHGRGTLAGMIPDERLFDDLVLIAKENNIPIQYEVSLGVLTETAFIEFAGSSGVPCASLSIPTRYSHTQIETVSINDLMNAEKLLYNFILSLKSNKEYGKSIYNI